MGCNGTCALPSPNKAPSPPRTDGACCDKCAAEDARKAKRSAHPLLRAMPSAGLVLVAKVPQQTAMLPSTVMDYGASHPMAVIAPNGRMLGIKPSGDTSTTAAFGPGTNASNYAADCLRGAGLTCAEWSNLSAKDKTEAAMYGAQNSAMQDPRVTEAIGALLTGLSPATGAVVSTPAVVAAHKLLAELVANIDRYCAAQSRLGGITRGVALALNRGGSRSGFGAHPVLGIKPSGDAAGPRFPGSIGTGPTEPVGRGMDHHGGRGMMHVDPPSFLLTMGWVPSYWCGLSSRRKAANARAFNLANPGSIPDEAAFVSAMERYCQQQMLILGRSGELSPSGDITWGDASATTAAVARDQDGNTISLDSNGYPIPGTGVYSDDNGGGQMPDSLWSGDGAYSLSDSVTYGGGSIPSESYSESSSTPSPVAAPVNAAQSAAQLAATRALWSTVGSLITSAGTDIAAIINAGNQQALAEINANLALALHNDASPTTGLPLTDAQRTQMLQLQSMLAPASPPTSTTTKVAYGAGALGIAYVAAKAFKIL